jgi:hypothetical protein
VSVPVTAIPTAISDRPIPAPPEFAGAPAAVTAAPLALATVSTPAGAAASSFADVLGDLLGPIQAFIDGAALLVRRTLLRVTGWQVAGMAVAVAAVGMISLR